MYSKNCRNDGCHMRVKNKFIDILDQILQVDKEPILPHSTRHFACKYAHLIFIFFYNNIAGNVLFIFIFMYGKKFALITFILV